jgi:acyl carrier protein
LLKFVIECFDKGTFKPIRVDRVFDAPLVLDAFRYMQQGKHIGKIILQIRDGVEGKLLVTEVDSTKRARLDLDPTGSYLLVGGLGGLGRSISVWMVQHGARHITYLSRSAGRGKHDADFVREIESMGCTVNLVAGDVSKADDVARAIDTANATAALKGIVQMSMVLRDQMFQGMSIEDWNTVTAPKVQGTWNLHEITTTRGIDLDFFLLFSSLSGILGQIGQANYASANTFLDAFVQYRASVGLPGTAIDLGAMEGVGYLSENQELLRKMQGSGWRPVQEVELLNALELGMKPNTTNTFLLGVAPSIPLSHPGSSARLRRDVRLAAYHNIGGGASQASGSATDGLRAFLGTVKKDPSTLQSPETAELLATEIGKKLAGLLLLGDAEVDIKTSTADMGLDSLVAVELRAWWKLTFGFDISTLEMLSLGTLEALGKRAVDGLIQLYGA